jgi:hypothetical protein
MDSIVVREFLDGAKRFRYQGHCFLIKGTKESLDTYEITARSLEKKIISLVLNKKPLKIEPRVVKFSIVPNVLPSMVTSRS